MQIDTWNTPPLPQRAAPQPWEDIASVISRTARKMGYGDPKWVLQPELIPHKSIAPNPRRIDTSSWIIFSRFHPSGKTYRCVRFAWMGPTGTTASTGGQKHCSRARGTACS
jgi:hypothetical protein